MKRAGAIEQEKLQAVQMLKDGATLQEIADHFKWVEPDYWKANEAHLYELAGLKAKK